MSFCPNCGHEQPDTNKFCTACGMPLLTLEADESLLPEREAETTVETPSSPVVNSFSEYAARSDEPMKQPGYFVPGAVRSESIPPQTGNYYQPAPERSESDLPPVRKIGFGEAVRLFFKQYATFSGRATRAEFWWGVLFEYLYTLAVYLVAVVVGLVMVFSGTDRKELMTVISFVLLAGSLVLVVPQLALIWRRLHDVGHSGWFVLVMLIPFVGYILLLVQYFLPSDADNRYGPRKTEGTPEPEPWHFVPGQYN